MSDRLLAECLRVDLPITQDTDLESVISLCRSFDGWSGLAGRAAYEGVICWTHEVLSHVDGTLVPAETVNQLYTARLSHTARLFGMARDQSAVTGALRENHVDCMMLKGPVLSEEIYPDTSLRNYSDMDLLVRKEDVERAGEVFRSLGYQLVDEDRDNIFKRDKTQVHYYGEGMLPIDLHWDLINLPSHDASFAIDLDEIWASARTVGVSGMQVKTLSKEDTLLFQCAHLTAHHDFNRLLWFKDVEQVVRRFSDEIDWALFVAKARKFHLKTFMYYSLVMTANVVGDLPVPEFVYEELTPRYYTARLFERLASKSNILELQNSRRSLALEVWWAIRDNQSHRYGAILKRAFPKVEWYLECYPFLPKVKHYKLYYGAYPVLMVLRLLKRPVQQNLSETLKSR